MKFRTKSECSKKKLHMKKLLLTTNFCKYLKIKFDHLNQNKINCRQKVIRLFTFLVLKN